MTTLPLTSVLLSCLLRHDLPREELIKEATGFVWSFDKPVWRALLRMRTRGLVAEVRTATGRLVTLTAAGRELAEADAALMRSLVSPPLYPPPLPTRSPLA